MVTWCMLAVLAAAAPAGTRAASDPRVRARMGGEHVIDAADALRPPSKRRVHGSARLSLGFGFVADDPTAKIEPAVALDLRAIAPVKIAFAAPLRLRMADRAPADRGVLRLRDWDEVGDYFAVLRSLEVRLDRPLARRANAHVELTLGEQRDVTLGHGSLVRGWANGLDLDRRRTGLLGTFGLRGTLLGQPAHSSVEVLAGDVAGSQILGGRVAASWAGAGIGATVVGDPTAPRLLAVDAADPIAYVSARGNRLQTSGARGIAAGSIELEYLATDRWRWRAGPYLDLGQIGDIGRGLHLGATALGRLGARRQWTLGATTELTAGTRGYDPAYYDVFYGAQRWSAPMLGTRAGVPDDAADPRAPKPSWLRDHVPAGVGGMGRLHVGHTAGATASFEYRMRPGPLGHTATLVVGVDVPQVAVFARFAHRGTHHGFEPRAAGTLAQLELRVPVLRWIDVEIAAGWTFAIRSDPRLASARGVLPSGAGLVLAGVGGRVPW